MAKKTTRKSMNLTTCSGMGATLKGSKSKSRRSTAGSKLSTKCKKKGTLFAKTTGSKARKVGLKADGTLKKGYRYARGGRVVKAKKK